MFKPNFIKALCSDEATCFVLKMFSNMCHHTESTCWCDNCVALVRVSWNLTLITEAFLSCALPFGKVDCISLELFHCTMFCRWKCFRCLLSVPAIDALLFVLVSNLKTIIKKSGKNQCHSYYAIDCKEKQVNGGDKWPLWFALVIVSILQHPCGQTQFPGKVDVALVEPSNAVILVVDVVSDVLQILQVGPEQVFMDKVSTGIYCMVNKAKQ